MHQWLGSAGAAFFAVFLRSSESSKEATLIVRLTHRTGSPRRSVAKGFRSEFKGSYSYWNMSVHLLIAVSFAEVVRSSYYVFFSIARRQPESEHCGRRKSAVKVNDKL